MSASSARTLRREAAAMRSAVMSRFGSESVVGLGDSVTVSIRSFTSILSGCAPVNLLHPLQQVVPHAERIRHDRQPRIHRAARRKEARVDHI